MFSLDEAPRLIQKRLYGFCALEKINDFCDVPLSSVILLSLVMIQLAKYL